MTRPDQDRFDAFAKHFEVLDAELNTYCASYHFELEKNLLRQPGRVLRRRGKPEFLIDISLSGYWLEMEFSEDMPHTITAIGYYDPPESPHIWKISREIVSREPFSKITPNVRNYLDQARHLIEQWTPEVMLDGTGEAALDTLPHPSTTGAQVGGFGRASAVDNGNGTVTFTRANYECFVGKARGAPVTRVCFRFVASHNVVIA